MSRAACLLTAAALVAACRSSSAPGAARVSKPGVYEGYSKAEYDGYQRSSQYLTMRDGVRLAADILRPTRNGALHRDKLPVIWTQHRYNRAFFQADTLVDYVRGLGEGMHRQIHHGHGRAAI